MANTTVHLKLTGGEGALNTEFSIGNWERSHFQIRPGNPPTVKAGNTEKNEEVTFMQVTLTNFWNNKYYTLYAGGGKVYAPDDGGAAGGDAVTSFAVHFIKASPGVWDALLKDAKSSAYCCSPLSDVKQYDNLPGACERAGLAVGSDACKASLGARCKGEGFMSADCRTWCIDNPTDCRPVLESWCQKNMKETVCKCFDFDGWAKYNQTIVNPKCEDDAVCKLSGNLSNYGAGCFYPPCLASGMASVYTNNVACPNNVVSYNKCLSDLSVSNGGVINGDVAIKCIQDAEINTGTDSGAQKVCADGSCKMPDVKLDALPGGGGDTSPPSGGGGGDSPPPPPPESVPPPPPPEEEKNFFQKWWWVLLISGIGGLIIIGLILWLVLSSPSKPKMAAPTTVQK